MEKNRNGDQRNLSQMLSSSQIEAMKNAPVAMARSNGNYFSIAIETIQADSLILTLVGWIFSTPTRYSIQLDWDCHIDWDREGNLEKSLDLYAYQFTNHSCAPNMLLRDGSFHAIKTIHRGEELTFNYNTTEYEMTEPFKCDCGSLFCSGFIRGFKHLPSDEKEKLRPMLSSYLLSLLDKDADIQEAKIASRDE